MNEGVSEAMEVTYTKGQMNGDPPTQGEIVTSTMVWELGEAQYPGSARATVDKQFSPDFTLKLLSILSASWE